MDLRALLKKLSDPSVKSAVSIRSSREIVRLTRRCKPDARASRSEYVLTIGRPNAREEDFIKDSIKSGQPYKGIWTRRYAKKK